MEIIIEPLQPPMTRAEFCATRPKGSIGLDGYIYGAPWKDMSGPWYCFNHHEECDRSATRATCAQVLMALRQGLFAQFAYGNDCDEDMIASTFLLKNPHLVRGAMNPQVNRLIYMVDMLDATAGTYPFPVDLPILEELAWIMDPYKRCRLSGDLDRKNAQTYMGVLEDGWSRISRHIMGNGGRIKQDTRYDVLFKGKGWVLVREVGAQAKAGIIADGHQVYVSLRDRPQGGYTYVIWRAEFNRLSLNRTFHRLNEAEGTVGNADRWGGGDSIGGSPRVAGSKLDPFKDVSVIVDEEMVASMA